MPTPSYTNASLDRNARSREWERTGEAASLKAMQQAQGYEDEPSYEEIMAGAKSQLADPTSLSNQIHRAGLNVGGRLGVGETADPDAMAPKPDYNYGDVVGQSAQGASLPMSFLPGPAGLISSIPAAMTSLQIARDPTQSGMMRGIGAVGALATGFPALRALKKVGGRAVGATRLAAGKVAGASQKMAARWRGDPKGMTPHGKGPSYEVGTLGRAEVKPVDEIGRLERFPEENPYFNDPNYSPPSIGKKSPALGAEQNNRINPRTGEVVMPAQNLPTPRESGPLTGLKAASAAKAPRPVAAPEPITDPETMMLLGELEAGGTRAAEMAAARAGSSQAVPQTLWRGTTRPAVQPSMPGNLSQESSLEALAGGDIAELSRLMGRGAKVSTGPRAVALPPSAATRADPANLSRQDILEALASGDEAIKRQIMFGGAKVEGAIGPKYTTRVPKGRVMKAKAK